MAALCLRRRPYLDLLPGPAPFEITVIRRSSARGDRDRAGLSRVPPDLQRRMEGFARRGGRLAASPAAGQRARRVLVRHARGAVPRPRARPRAAGRDRLLGLQHRRAVGVLSRLRRSAAARGDHHGLLRRLPRQPAAAAGRHRRRRRRHDRRVRGVRRAALLVVPAVWPTGFPVLASDDPGRIAYFQLRRTSRSGARRRHSPHGAQPRRARGPASPVRGFGTIF